MIEAICRQYITGSMWRAYAKGGREFCGIAIPDGLERDTKVKLAPSPPPYPNPNPALAAG